MRLAKGSWSFTALNLKTPSFFNIEQCLHEYPYAQRLLTKQYQDGIEDISAFQGRLFLEFWKAIAECLRRPLPISNRRALSSQRLNASRNFSQTPLVLKKGGKAAKQEARSSGTEEQADNPHDFSLLETGIQKAIERLQEELSKLRTGGRFNPELLESIRVQLKKDNKLTIRLGDLAQVVPKGGKSVVVLVGEAAVSWSISILSTI